MTLAWAPPTEAVGAFLRALFEERRGDGPLAAVGVQCAHRTGPVVELRRIGVAPGRRGRGDGGRALERLCELADDFGVDLYVQPCPDDPAMAARLRAWYVRHGFDEPADGDRLLRRALSRPALRP